MMSPFTTFLEQNLLVELPITLFQYDKNFYIKTYPHFWELKDFPRYCPGIGTPAKSSVFNIDNKLEGFIRLFADGVYSDSNRTSDALPLMTYSTHPSPKQIALYFDLVNPVQVLQSGLKFKVRFTINQLSKEMAITVRSYEPGRGWGFTSFCPRNIALQQHMSHAGSYGKAITKLVIKCEVTVVYDKLTPQPIICDKPLPGTLSSDLGEYDDNEEFSDVTLVAGSEVFHAHRVILAARSPVFRTMFTHDMSETLSSRVVIEDMDETVLQSLVTYLYTDEVDCMDEMASELLPAADKYHLEDLRAKCEHALAANLSPENATHTFILADLHRSTKLRGTCVEYINRNRNEVSNTEGWQIAKETFPLLLVSTFL